MAVSKKKVGVILAYSAQLVSILTGLLYTPIMLNILGQSEFGLYQLVASVVSNLSLLSMGFTAAYIKFYSQEKTYGTDEGIARFNGMFMTVFAAISAICLFCGVVMLFNINAIFADGLTPEEYPKAKVLLIILVINMAINFINTVFDCCISAQEEFIFQKALLLLRNLLNPFVCLPLLLLGYGSIGMVGVSLGLTVLCLIVNSFFCIKKLHIRFKFDHFDWKLLKNMWKFTFFIFLNQIIDQVNWTIDKFLLGRMINTTAVAIYGVASTINLMYIQFSSAISNVFTPSINMMVTKNEDSKKIDDLFIKVGRIQFIILALVLSGFVFFGRAFLLVWSGEKYLNAYSTTLLLIVPITIPLIQNLGIDIQRAKNKHQVRSVVYTIMAVGNVLLSISLIKVMGVDGAALGTTITLLLCNGLFMNWYYYKRLNVNVIEFWKSIGSFIPAFILPIVVGVGTLYFFEMKGVISLIFGILVYTLVYALSMYFFGMNSYEKGLVKSAAQKLIRRKHD